MRVAIIRGPGLPCFGPVSNSYHDSFKRRATNSEVGELLKRLIQRLVFLGYDQYTFSMSNTPTSATPAPNVPGGARFKHAAISRPPFDAPFIAI